LFKCDYVFVNFTEQHFTAKITDIFNINIYVALKPLFLKIQ